MPGENQYPAQIPRLRPVVREYMARLTALGHAIMRGVALGLGIDPAFFKEAMTADPFTPFRLFNYPHPVRTCNVRCAGGACAGAGVLGVGGVL